MKLDLAKLPVLEGVIAFLLVMTVVTFVGAFASTDGEGEAAVVAESPTPRDTPPPGGSPTPGAGVEVVMRDNSFEPDEMTVQAGTTVTFEITNEGRALHSMHIAGQSGDYAEDFCEGGGDPCSDPNRLAGGDTATLIWDAPAEPGEVDFRCDFHPRDMTGTITIE
jgi:plastocyanin